MKYINEYRDPQLAKSISAAIHAEVDPARQYSYMEFCGGHTHAISRYGVEELLPSNLRMVHGPGCPVCVLPIGRIDQAINLALTHKVILATYGDTMRVPASHNLSLMRAKAQGADIRMVYSAADAIGLAQAHPDREVVFFAIGFETTTPPTAMVIKMADKLQLKNFSVLCCHVLTPAAITHIMEAGKAEHADTNGEAAPQLDGFVGPAHVSIIIGSAPYEAFAATYKKPVVIAGFEPLDVMQAILMLVRLTNSGRYEVENEFIRAVSRDGNIAAQQQVADVLELREHFEWRGLGEMAHSALKIRAAYAQFDAELRYHLNYQSVPDHKKCECGTILRGIKRPKDCTLFGNVCTPESPVGSCMVSSEGACAAHYSYGRFRDVDIVAA